MGNKVSIEEDMDENLDYSEEPEYNEENIFLEDHIIKTLSEVEKGIEYTYFSEYTDFKHDHWKVPYCVDCVFRPNNYPYRISLGGWSYTDECPVYYPETKWNTQLFNLNLLNNDECRPTSLKVRKYRIRKYEDDKEITFRMFFMTQSMNFVMKSGNGRRCCIIFINTLTLDKNNASGIYSDPKIYYSMEYVPTGKSISAKKVLNLEGFDDVDIGIIRKRVERRDGGLTKATR